MTVRFVVSEADGAKRMTVADAVAAPSSVVVRRVTVGMATRQGHPFTSMTGAIAVEEHDPPPGEVSEPSKQPRDRHGGGFPGDAPRRLV